MRRKVPQEVARAVCDAFERDSQCPVHLIGPGGAGKSTAAPCVAALLGIQALDLDRAFEAVNGDIDDFIAAHGYAAYAATNVDTYLAHGSTEPTVIALSSGFMVYPEEVHPAIRELQRHIAAAPTTVLLLPSLDLGTCVAETVRRQAVRPLAIHRTAAREEAVIRDRFDRYRHLTPRVVTTMQPVQSVAREIVECLAGRVSGSHRYVAHPSRPDSSSGRNLDFIGGSRTSPTFRET